MASISLDDQQMLTLITAASLSDYSFISPVLTAAYRGQIELAILPRGATWPRQELRHRRRPTLLMVGDDDYVSSGPSGWPSQMRTWPARAMVHAAGGCHHSYRLAVTNCLACGRYALIETDSAHMLEWTNWFMAGPSPIRLDIVRPKPGATHPKPVRDQQRHHLWRQQRCCKRHGPRRSETGGKTA